MRSKTRCSSWPRRVTAALHTIAAVTDAPANPGTAITWTPMRMIWRSSSRSSISTTPFMSATPPLMVKTAGNPGGLPMEVFDQIRAGVLADRSQFFKDLTLPFYGYNRSGAKVSEGVREQFWRQGVMAGRPACYFCIKAVSETDQTEDLKKIDVPTLIIHGDDDQS